MYIKRRDKEENLYHRLQERSLKMLQELSGNIWTDYNAHDPGMTILDILNYALLELHYITNFPFPDYLHKEHRTQVNYTTYGLFPAGTLFSPSHVTTADYEELISGTLNEVISCKAKFTEKHMWKFKIELAPGANREETEEKIRTLYHSCRNLCENLGKIEFRQTATASTTDYPRKEITENKIRAESPASTRKEKPSYHSIQYDFPDCYGINERGMPAGITKEHQARIRQLQGYLLLFDYLLGETFEQINDIPGLLEFSPHVPGNSMPEIDLEDIYKLTNKEQLAASTLRQTGFMYRQKENYLNLLETFYGEDPGKIPAYTNLPSGAEKIKIQTGIIRNMLQWNVNRYRSFNLYDKSPENVATITQTVSALFNIETATGLPVTNLFSRYNIRIISDKLFFNHYRQFIANEFLFENPEENWPGHTIETVPHRPVKFSEQRLYQLKKQLNLFWHNILFESFLEHGNNPEYYRIIQLEEKHGYLLIFKHPEMSHWINMGFFFEKEFLIEITNQLWAFLEKLHLHSYAFYPIEHILLDEDPYTLTLILSSRNLRFHSGEHLEEMLCERLPAHLTLQILWVNADGIYDFEKRYFAWRKAWSEKNESRIRETGKAILDFINREKRR